MGTRNRQVPSIHAGGDERRAPPPTSARGCSALPLGRHEGQGPSAPVCCPRAAQAPSTRVPALPNAAASGLPTACGPPWGWERSSACQPAVYRQSTWPAAPFKGRDCILDLYFFSTPRHVARAERTYWRNTGCQVLEAGTDLTSTQSAHKRVPSEEGLPAVTPSRWQGLKSDGGARAERRARRPRQTQRGIIQVSGTGLRFS